MSREQFKEISVDKLDLKMLYKSAYSGKREPRIVEIPSMQYITFSGKGAPESQLFQDAMGVLFPLAYTIKFMFKERDKDFVVAPVEGQWWSKDLSSFNENRKEDWLWKLMICVPSYVSQSDFDAAKMKLQAKSNPTGLEHVILETIEDGESVQVLYIGPYSGEAETIAGMHHNAKEQGYKLRSHHREVYLSDMRRTAPGKLKTIIRHPIEKV